MFRVSIADDEHATKCGSDNTSVGTLSGTGTMPVTTNVLVIYTFITTKGRGNPGNEPVIMAAVSVKSCYFHQITQKDAGTDHGK